MSDELILAPDLQTLERAGWSNAELIWEQIQETAAQCLNGGEPTETADLWHSALEIARDYFSTDDLRLVTSLANCALAFCWAKEQEKSQAYFTEASAVWHRRERWISALRSERRARSAMYHFRLQQRYPGGYAHLARQRYSAMAEEIGLRLEQLQNGASDTPDRLPRWHREKPQGFDDARKLIAAVCLLA